MSKNVVITGANRGIGLCLAQQFKSRGDKVFGVCRTSSAELDRVADLVIDGVDVSKAEGAERLAAALEGTKIDLLINNAGILNNEEMGQLDFNAIEKQFQVNTLGPLRITEQLLDNFAEGTKIALITSRMGSITDNTSGSRYGYRMSKAALNAVGMSMTHDLKPRGIAVGIYHPGYVMTDMTGHNGDITPELSAERLVNLIDKLDLSNSGTFWHSNGEILPW